MKVRHACPDSLKSIEQGNLFVTDRLYKKVLAIDEKLYGPDHVAVATDLNNRALLLEVQVGLHEGQSKITRVVSGSAACRLTLYMLRDSTFEVANPEIKWKGLMPSYVQSKLS